MKKLVGIISTIVMVASLQSCYYDKADLLYPNSAACDTTATASYSTKVVPLLNAQCYSCHRGGSGGITMGTYATDKAIAVNGKLYGSINHSSGYVAMPQGAPKMISCNIALVKKWVDAGSPNN